MDHFLDIDIANIVARIKEPAKQLAGKNILIAGGAGFLGRYWLEVFRQLNKSALSAPCRVTILDNLITGTGTNFATDPNFSFVQHDIVQPLTTEFEADYIIHAAGIASPYYYRAYPVETLEVSTTGTKNLLHVAEQQRAKFVFFSSSEIYGDPDPRHVPMSESYRGNVSTMGPRACYDEGKRVGETYCHVFHENFGVDVNIIRPFNVYGPGMRENDYRVLPNFASNIVAGRPVSIYGSGQQTRTYCYVEDAIVGFFLVMLRGVPGTAYNIGNPAPEISVNGLLEVMGDVLGRKVDYRCIEYPDTYPADEPQRRCPDIRKAQLQLDFHPQVTLQAGLKRYLDWALKVYTGAV